MLCLSLVYLIIYEIKTKTTAITANSLKAFFQGVCSTDNFGSVIFSPPLYSLEHVTSQVSRASSQ